MLRSLLLFAFCFATLGCGQATYDARLNETSGYYAYINETEALLDGEWKSREPLKGIQIRPPKGFKKISAPTQEEDEDGNIISEGVDERQPINIPGFYQGELPGVLGAWKRNYEVSLAGDGSQEFTVRLYVLGQTSFGEEGNDLPFRDIVYNRLAADMSVESANSWLAESYPGRDLYTRAIDYNEMRFSPGVAVNGFASSGVEIQLNARTEDGKSVVIMWVLPAGGLSSRESRELTDSVTKTLQTLSIRKTSDTDSDDPEEVVKEENPDSGKKDKPKPAQRAPSF
ncbi:hypothetical protein Pla110_31070 [Polystyrenella longa]|uniref:Lipoprotein n=1 Tax=Polystyrenella longa TaxID=2528007 RepID=A0A518CQ65_9PLAN|nr:hypothetical protein [Polystyrenella longa]QDU81366.1 hypothetical protein Pla110_31070 [Polystyrenella longa]